MSEEVHDGRAGEIQIASSLRIPDINAFAAGCSGEFFAERAQENGAANSSGGGFAHGGIIAFGGAEAFTLLILTMSFLNWT